MSKETTSATVPSAKQSSSHGIASTGVSSASAGSWLKNVGYLIFLGIAFGAGWYLANTQRAHQGKDKLPAESASTEKTSGVMVTVEPVVHRPVQRTVEALGTLHGFEEVSISARVEGRVRKVLHDVADHVTPGEVLLEIDPKDDELSVQQSDRALQVELAKLGLKEPPDSKLDLGKVPVVVKAKSVMDHAKSRLERINRLASTKTVSPEDAENAANDYRTAQAEYDNQLIQAESGLATIQMKQVDLEIAREHLTNTKVVAPTPTVTPSEIDHVTYVVSQRSVSEGTLVRPGTEIFRVVINQTLKLRVAVPERFTSEVQLKQPVAVHTATSSTPFPGTVTRIFPTVDASTRTFQVEIQVPNSKEILKPGSFAKAEILTHVDEKAATVPLSALIQFAGVTKIYLADNGRSKEVPVTLGAQTTEWVEIATPASPSDALVITSGQTAIADDTAVTVRSDSKPLTGSRHSSDVDSQASRESAERSSQGLRE